MILTLVFAFCLSIAMVGVARADGTLYEAKSFTMTQEAQVRTLAPNGIRFSATIDAQEYADSS